MTVLTARRRASVGTWTPAKLSGVLAWWRADDIAGTDGTAVATWTDRVAGQAITQATSGNRPTLKTGANGINGQPVARFVAANSQTLSGARGAIPAVGPVYIWAMFKRTGAGVTQQRVASIGKTAVTNQGVGFGTFGAALQMTTYAVADINSSYGVLGSGSFALWGLSGTAKFFHRDNLYTVETGAASNANAGADTFSLGGRATSNDQMYDGDIAEIIVSNTMPSAAELRRLARYMADRYAITVGTPYNSSAPATTPSADASGTCVETSVLYIPGGWNGHSYWCGFVPYGSNSVANENPTILYSDDGNTWTSPAGISVPVVAYPGGGAAGNNSDPALFYNPGDSKLYLYYQRESTTPISLGGVWWTSSSDGSTWSAVTQLASATAQNSDFEPKVVYTGTEWWLYTIDGNAPGASVLHRRVSSTGPTSGYGSRVACSLTLPNGLKVWHNGNVTRLNGKWVCCFSDNQVVRQIWVASSLDGLNWTVAPKPLLIAGGISGAGVQWDLGSSIYRLTLVDSGDGVNAWGWYSTLGGSVGSVPTRMSQRVAIPFSEIP